MFEHRDTRTGKLSIRYHWRGTDYTKREMRHLKMLRVPGMLRGLGPVQAARLTFEGALEMRDYGAKWLGEAQAPDGVLTTEQELAPGQAEQYRNVWYGRNADGSPREGALNTSERLRVLGKGLKYEPLTLKPEDVQFLATQEFNTLDIARLIGAPPSLLLVAVSGSSQSYQNVEQEWIGYTRFTLMKPLREMEEAFTELLPRGQTCRFTLEVLLRSDTKTRYEGHRLAIEAGWMDADEVRAIEGLPPLTDEQRAAIDAAAATRTPTPRKQPRNDRPHPRPDPVSGLCPHHHPRARDAHHSGRYHRLRGAHDGLPQDRDRGRGAAPPPALEPRQAAH
ncbi:hypothetical protein AWU67_04575 [Microterricola viridarii]|uniref:Phage portal protein, HK97 family n=1 Tax=Microterricola viridarii TaxID=412690 RepID=A0A0X8E273_9MICO|nr:hypothetical protein AWU67_04575 [Microterricola viridarii]